MFADYGNVLSVSMFYPHKGSATSRGAGLVKMETREAAQAAKDALHGVRAWPGMQQPMVVDWMDSELQRQRRERHRAQAEMAAGRSMTGMAPSGTQPYQQQATAAAAAAVLPLRCHHMAGSSPLGLLAAASTPLEQPPAGCLPDAIKLYVGNLPPGLQEAGLRQLLVAAGHVVRLELHPPPAGSKAGPTASVWYATRQQALQAVQQLHMRVMMQRMGRRRGPVIVRPAAGWELRDAGPDHAGTDQQHAAAQPAALSREGLVMRPCTAQGQALASATSHVHIASVPPAAGYQARDSGGLGHASLGQQHHHHHQHHRHQQTQHHRHQHHHHHHQQQWPLLSAHLSIIAAAQQQANPPPLGMLPYEVLLRSYSAAAATQHSLLEPAALLLLQQQRAGTAAFEQRFQAGLAAGEPLVEQHNMPWYVTQEAQHQHQQRQYQQQQQQPAALLADHLAGTLQLQPAAGLVPAGSGVSSMQYMHLQQE